MIYLYVEYAIKDDYMKKYSTKLLALVMIVALFFTFSVFSGTAATYIVDGDWKYEMTLSNDCYYIAEYTGDDTRVNIPALYNDKPIVKVNLAAFLNNTNMLYVNFPATVTEIGDNAFYGCTSLKTLQLPTSVAKIGNNAFYGCTSLSSVTINAGSDLKTIPNYAFSACTNLSSVSIPEGVESISGYAFSNCEKLISVVVPGSVNTIANTAFYNSPNLTIYGWSDTYAETYASEMNIPFFSFGEYVAPTEPSTAPTEPSTAPVPTVIPTTVPVTNPGTEYIMGDADLDGKINIKDATLIQKFTVKLETLTDIQIVLSNVNSTGGVNIKDATIVQKYVASYPQESICGEKVYI